MDNSGDDQDPVLTDQRRARFESLGVEIVRAELARGGSMHVGGPQAREAARQWLAEKDAARLANNRADRLRQRAGVILAGGNLLLSIVRVLGVFGAGLFIGYIRFSQSSETTFAR